MTAFIFLSRSYSVLFQKVRIFQSLWKSLRFSFYLLLLGIFYCVLCCTVQYGSIIDIVKGKKEKKNGAKNAASA